MSSSLRATSSERAPSLVDSLFARADAAVADGDFSKGEILLRAADAMLLSTRSAIRLGEALLAWGRMEDARKALEVAWERSKYEGDAGEQRDACLALSCYWQECGDPLAAEQFRQVAIRNSMTADADGMVDGRTRLSVASGCLVGGARIAEAAHLLRGVLAGGDARASDASAMLAVLRLRGGRECLLDGVGELLYSAYRGHREQGDRLAAAADLFFVGHVLRTNGRYSEAATCYAGAAEAWESLGYIEDAADAGRASRECRRVDVAVGAVVGFN